MAERKLYIGMDVNNSYALVSYFMDGKKEPETPLIDTGALFSSISYEVVEGGASE